MTCAVFFKISEESLCVGYVKLSASLFCKKFPFVFTHAVITVKVYPFEKVIISGITLLFLALYFCFKVNYRASIPHFFPSKSVMSVAVT